MPGIPDSSSKCQALPNLHQTKRRQVCSYLPVRTTRAWFSPKINALPIIIIIIIDNLPRQNALCSICLPCPEDRVDETTQRDCGRGRSECRFYYELQTRVHLKLSFISDSVQYYDILKAKRN